MEDAASATAVLNRHSHDLHGTDDTTAAQVAEAWRSPEVDFPADVFLAERDGRLVGYADVFVWGDTAWLDVRATDPDALDPLLEASVRSASTKPVAYVRGWASEHDRAMQEAYERARFRSFRHSFRMEIGLEGELPEPVWPAGFAVRPFREGDERSFHAAHMASFADTWGFAEEPFEHWAHWMLGEMFQPDHWFVVETHEEVAAIAICRVSETEPGLGWVQILGVVPAYRRRGLALALLQHVFRHFAEHGLLRVGLGVDAENPTGAVALYERAGMHVARRDVRYERSSG